MPDLSQALLTISLVREQNNNDIPRVERILADAEAKNDPSAALPYFRGVRGIPGVWLVALPDPVKGVPGGAMVEALYRSASERYPAQQHTANWLVMVERSHRIATRQECEAFFKRQDEARRRNEEQELLRKKARAVTVRPADQTDFSGANDIEQLREKLRLLREIKKLEAE